MGGTSKQEQTQQSKTEPWAQAQPALTGILGQLQTQLGNTGLTGNESTAINQIISNAQGGNPFSSQISGVASNLLNGGGANAEAGNIQGGLDTYKQQLTPYANGSMIGNNPALQAQLDTIMSDVGNSVNSQFAAAGRDFSGANQQAYGRGVAQGLAPVMANQYNQDVSNQLNAAGSLYGAQNTSSGLLSGLNQQSLGNQVTGIGAAGDALNAQNASQNTILQAEAQRRGIPVEALGLLAQIGIPIAGLGGQSSGTSTGTQKMSGAQQFATIAGGLGSLFGGGGGSTAGNMAKIISDRRAKEDIDQVGTLFDGTPVYRYRYIGQPAFQIGVMAQDIEAVNPAAVGQIGEFKAVDYKLATDNALKMRAA